MEKDIHKWKSIKKEEKSYRKKNTLKMRAEEKGWELDIANRIQDKLITFGISRQANETPTHPPSPT